MWGKLNVSVFDNDVEIVKSLYYNSDIIKNEIDLNITIESLLDGKECQGAFLVDEKIANYIASMCQEAYNAGKSLISEVEEKYKNLKNKLLEDLERF